MKTPAPSPPCSGGADTDLASHHGILRVATHPMEPSVEVDFDPSVLSDEQVRALLEEHLNHVEDSIRKCAYRLEGRGCEACAAKLEKRVVQIPGVRTASATFIGKTLAVSLDPGIESEERVVRGLKSAGATVRPLIVPSEGRPRWVARLLKGDFNEELSCAMGLVFLIAAIVVGKASGTSWLTHLLYAGAYLFGGQEGVRSAIASLKERVLDVDVLMVLAALGAASIGAPFEGALLLFLFSFSNVLQRHAMERTQRAIEALLTLRPSEALVKRHGNTVTVPVEEVVIGETVIVKPGGRIPVDGLLTEGSTHVDESSLTGESMPVAKQPGATLFAGTINQSGGIELTATRLAGDSTLARMVQLVAEAQAEKSKAQRFLESAEQYYAMGVIGLTVLVFVIPWMFLGESFATAFYRAMTVMVVASPCALVISTPATVLSAIGGAARRGILIKGGSHLERAARIDIVAVDKTGTLTVGKPDLTAIITEDGVHPIDCNLPPRVSGILQSAAALESRSEHPLAHAIVSRALALGLEIPEATAFQSTAGKGAEASVGGVIHGIGSERMLREAGAIGMDHLLSLARPLLEDGKTCVWLGVWQDGCFKAIAGMAMADTIRPAARDLTEQLKRIGVKKIVMLTGDQHAVAQAIAREARVDEVHAELLPADKLEVIRSLKAEGSVMMVGDGVNDAPALAMSDLGVAMGAAGTDVAMETADIVLMGDCLENIPLLLAHARRARTVLYQNLVFASAVIVVLIISALGFALPLPLGVIGHEGSTVLVCLNGLRLLLIGRGAVTQGSVSPPVRAHR